MKKILTENFGNSKVLYTTFIHIKIIVLNKIILLKRKVKMPCDLKKQWKKLILRPSMVKENKVYSSLNEITKTLVLSITFYSPITLSLFIIQKWM